MRSFLFLCFLAGLAVLAASFGGRLHPLGDSLAVFRYQISVAILFIVALLVRGWRRLPAVLVLVLAIAVDPVTASLGHFAAAGAGRYTLYQKNLYYSNPFRDRVLADIRAIDPDIATFEEIGDRATAFWQAASAGYPSHMRCIGEGHTVAVMTKWPMRDVAPICEGDLGLAALPVLSPDGPVWVAAIHLTWPFPEPQDSQIDRLLPLLGGLDAPLILAGDFNNVPWSYALARIARATGSSRVGPVLRTFISRNRWLRLSIDHILVPGGRGTIRTRPLFGSDHLGVVARFDF